MSWLDAHDSFFMALVADDRITSLHGSIDADTPSGEASAEVPQPVPAARRACDASLAMRPCALVRATR